MRNRYPGQCYYCHTRVEQRAGHFERFQGGWRLIHAECVFKLREDKLKARLNNG